MTAYNTGDVLLVPYPFGERAGGQKRPVLVISSDEYNEGTGELIIAQITSRVSAPPRPGDCNIESWREANLPAPAIIRSRLATLETSSVLRKLGSLTEEDLERAQSALSKLLTTSSEKALSGPGG
ncbi:MAG: type II toxin-antitoxin system PemK/MazF family toxin [Dehalococcoidia bacterium]